MTNEEIERTSGNFTLKSIGHCRKKNELRLRWQNKVDDKHCHILIEQPV